jgi:hypothetical protein
LGFSCLLNSFYFAEGLKKPIAKVDLNPTPAVVLVVASIIKPRLIYYRYKHQNKWLCLT